MSQCLSAIYTLIARLWQFHLPWGVTYGAIISAVFGLPILVRAMKKFLP